MSPNPLILRAIFLTSSIQIVDFFIAINHLLKLKLPSIQFYAFLLRTRQKILHPVFSLTANKSSTFPPNKSTGPIPPNNTATSRSGPARNKLRAFLPCFFTLILRRLSSASPARQAGTNPVASTVISLSIFSGAIMCVSSGLNPLLFRQPNRLSICRRPPYSLMPLPSLSLQTTGSCPSGSRVASR